ncbi:VOC family protein [Streptomyces sp. NPDC020681]|uniref:VOC family protein n=1 Tax=Streptomyces sp. NPDC020681 TaxID=3365083 RepID=UPI0037ACEB27
MLRGFATVNFWAADLDAAKTWYTDVLGIAPYFERPGYAEFRIGDYQHELGLVDAKYAPSGQGNGQSAPGGAVMYWAVDDLEGTLEKLLAKGAKEYQPLTAHGDGGFVTASVVDPFGNVLGIMTNPHYMEILGAKA